MSDETYNGWTNYPTWCVNLWLTNDEGTYLRALDVTRGAVSAADDETRGIAAADALKDFVTDELAPDLGASFAADLLGYALQEVDWLEVADGFVTEVTAE